MHSCVCMHGRYLAAKSEADHYMRELKREQDEVIAVPDIGPPPSSPSLLDKINLILVYVR